MRTTLWAAAAAALLLAGPALGATPAERCESGKNREAGEYVECLQGAEARYALRGDAAARASALQRCADVYRATWTQIEGRAAGTCPSEGDQGAIEEALETASADVARALAGGPLAAQAKPLKTGQTGCWNASGNAIPCAGTGQDGELQKGTERVYVDNGDGTITDTATGLMWEKLSDDTGIHDKDNTYTWPNAFLQKIRTLNLEVFAGYTDWRLPNLTELQSIVDYGRVGPAVSPVFNTNCAQWCTVLTCSCTLGANTFYFWSSTSFNPHPSNVWGIFFYHGVVDRNLSPTASLHVRAVRGGS